MRIKTLKIKEKTEARQEKIDAISLIPKCYLQNEIKPHSVLVCKR